MKMRLSAVAIVVALLEVTLKVHGDVIYTSNIFMDIEWTASATRVTPTNTIYTLETAVASYIKSAWNPATAPTISGKDLLTTSVSFMDQNVMKSNTTVINSTVTLLYAAKDGEEISDLASTLTTIVPGKLLLARVGGILGPDVQSISLVFTNNGTTSYPFKPPKGCTASKGLVTGCIVLSIALVLVSSVLLWVAGGWYQVRQSMRDLLRYNTEDKLPYGARQQRTEDEDDDESPTKIGANPIPVGLRKGAFAMTPGRGLYQDETSSEIMSSTSDVLSPLSQTSLRPLGIKSISKLTREQPPDVKRERPHYASREDADYDDN